MTTETQHPVDTREYAEWFGNRVCEMVEEDFFGWHATISNISVSPHGEAMTRIGITAVDRDRTVSGCVTYRHSSAEKRDVTRMAYVWGIAHKLVDAELAVFSEAVKSA